MDIFFISNNKKHYFFNRINAHGYISMQFSDGVIMTCFHFSPRAVLHNKYRMNK